MAAFRFRLDRVLRYRRRVVELRSREVSAAEMSLAEVVGQQHLLGEGKLLLAEAWRDREVLERLRQRRHEEWRAEQERRERAELDEIGQQRAGRARTGIAVAAAQVAP